MVKLGSFDPSKDVIFPEERGNVFVFGSNLAGHHGAGAAKTAVEKYGAILGVAEGLMGVRYPVDKDGRKLPARFLGVNETASYAIPIKGFDIEQLPLVVIDYFVERFYTYSVFKTLDYHVTRIGCGLGGYTDKEITPLFRKHDWGDNVFLPRGW